MENTRSYLEYQIQKGIERCHPRLALPPFLNALKSGRNNYIIGAGKAAAEMANVVYKHLGNDIIGSVVTRYGHGENIDTGPIEVLTSNHPIPDENGVRAAFKILSLVTQAEESDCVICLISGGGSALMTCPAPGITLETLSEITDCLVKSGVPISDINCVRRHLSRIKGGRLAKAAAPAKLVTYAISDVVGDDPADIASGPTVPAIHEPERAVSILEHSGYPVTEELKIAIMENEVKGDDKNDYHIVARNADALNDIRISLKADGWTLIDLGDNLIGDAAKTGSEHAKAILPYFDNLTEKFAFISGGELTVDIKEKGGDGGPNLEYLAALCLNLPINAPYHAMACDSDGIDGSQDNAGGYVSGNTVLKCNELDLDILAALELNNTYPLFKKLGQLVITGPSGTNVNDIRIVLVSPEYGTSP